MGNEKCCRIRCKFDLGEPHATGLRLECSVLPDDGTTEAIYIMLLRNVLDSVHGNTGARDLHASLISSRRGGGLGRIVWFRGSDTGAGLESGGPLLRCEVIGASPSNLAWGFLVVESFVIV